MPVSESGDGGKRVEAPLTDDDVRALRAGDRVRIFGRVYGARDAAHKRLIEMLDRGEPLPVDLAGQIVYYVGPTPARPGAVIGAAGPTTAGRMDRYTPRLLELGLKAAIGKGGRGEALRPECERNTACYMAALGGAGALISRSVKQARVVAFEELGPEAIYELELENFPAWVVNDCYGADHYATVAAPWRKDGSAGSAATSSDLGGG
ncbi:MAG: FumA C-terminus/TtdB family hydratase beta subunit [Actinomycetota bacterium]